MQKFNIFTFNSQAIYTLSGRTRSRQFIPVYDSLRSRDACSHDPHIAPRLLTLILRASRETLFHAVMERSLSH